MSEYNHKDIEKKWQDRWAEEGIFKTKDRVWGKKNEYILSEFVYPSGNLHVGHWYAFSVTDFYARMRRMQGRNVLFPMGFDAFGLPAENAAIKRGLNPRDWTYENIDSMKKQFGSMGNTFDWDREIITSDPEYYKWTQWLFTEFYKKGLAKQGETTVNWCPECKTVLANEQVVDGHCERCDSTVIQKEMTQWQLKITDYADRLIDDLDELSWPESIKESQRNWIGRKEGAKIKFKVKGTEKDIEVFTTRPETIYGATYLVLAPEHPLVDRLAGTQGEVMDYVNEALKKKEMERIADTSQKTGVRIHDTFAINPANGEEIPIFVADYVLGNFGTGSIMAVPAHDQRDFEFATKFYLPIKQVIAPLFIDNEDNPPQEGKKWSPRKNIQIVVNHPTEDKIIQIQWKKHPWKTFVIGGVEDGESYEEAAIRELTEETGYKNIKSIKQLGWQMEAQYFAKHKDENRKAFVRIFEVHLADLEQDELSEEEKASHDAVWVPKKEMKNFKPVAELPHIIEYHGKPKKAFEGKGQLINSGDFDGNDSEDAKSEITTYIGGEITKTYRLRDWVVSRQRYWGCPIPIIHCADCGTVPVPESDLPVVLPEIDDYLPRDDGKSPLAKATEWMNVKCPKCNGDAERETDTLDTFVDSSWYFLRYLDPKNTKRFASKGAIKKWMPVDFYSGGAEHTTMHLLFSRFFYKVMGDIGIVKGKEPYSNRLNRSLILGPDGNKMSKSKGNVVDPDKEVEKVGADALRMYLAFMGPYNETGSYPWDPNGVVGTRRFLERVWRVSNELKETTPENIEKELHKMIKKVTEEFTKLKFNVGIAQMMSFMNLVEKEGIAKKEYSELIKLLSVCAPHISEELWAKVGNTGFVTTAKWPVYDENMIKEENMNIVVQVNGKVRANIEVPVGTSEEDLKEQVLQLEDVQKWIEGKEIRKTIYVENKLFNIVV